MSKLARLPISFKDVDIIKKDDILTIKGKLGSLDFKLNPNIKYDINNETKEIKLDSINKSLLGTNVRILSNCITYVNKKSETKIELVGTGFKCKFDSGKRILELIIGYSHSVFIEVPSIIDVEILKGDTNIIFSSIDNQQLGIFISKVCNLKKYNVYTGNGIIIKEKTKKIKKVYLKKEKGK